MAEHRKRGQIPEVAVALAKIGYVMREKLGSGSYAEVRCAWRVNDPKTPLAVKIVNRDAAPPEFIDKFFPRELYCVQKLQHPNIITLHQVVEFGNYTCLIMDRAERGDLLDHITNQGALPDDRARLLFTQIALALQHCHQNKIAHRDLKCENILLDGNGHAKLTDFGFARSCVDPETQKRILSKTYCGSAAYAAPEIISGSPYNPLMSDVWSLGIILFIMVTGVMPFDDSDRLRLLCYQREKKWKFPSRMDDLVNPVCKLLIRRMLEPDITRRATLRQILNSVWLLVPDDHPIKNVCSST